MFKGIARFGIVAMVMVLLHRLIFETTALLSARIITVVGLDSLNPQNWIGDFMGLASLAGVTWISFRLTTILFDGRRKQSFMTLLCHWSQSLGKPLIIGLVAYSACNVVGIPNPPKFLLSAVLSLATSPAVFASKEASSLIRGLRLGSAQGIANQWRWRFTRDLIPWGAGFIEPFMEPTHFLLLGNIGSGKSTFMQVMMSRMRGVKGVGIIPDMRAIVLDAKREWVPFLAALGVAFTIWNPLDQRRVAWAISRDIQSEAMAQEFANIILETGISSKKKRIPISETLPR